MQATAFDLPTSLMEPYRQLCCIYCW